MRKLEKDEEDLQLVETSSISEGQVGGGGVKQCYLKSSARPIYIIYQLSNQDSPPLLARSSDAKWNRQHAACRSVEDQRCVCAYVVCRRG